MTQMFAATHYQFGINDRDEGASGVYTYAVSADTNALISAIVADMQDGDMVNVEIIHEDDEIQIKGSFDSADEVETYYVIKAVNSL